MTHYSKAEKLEAIKEYNESGLSLRQFAFNKQYTWYSLRRWLIIFNSGNMFNLFSQAEKQAIICQLSVFDTVSEKYEALQHYGFTGGKVKMLRFIDTYKRCQDKQKKVSEDKFVMSNSMRLVMGLK